MMTTAKKAMALTLCAVMLVVGSVAGTMAYLTDSEAVTNTFTVGRVGLTLDEAKVTEYGVAEAGAARVKENEYKLIPGQIYVKDPTVTVDADSEESYIRMIVTITDLADLKTACGVAANDYFLPQNFVQGWDNNIWETTGVIKEENNSATYEFRYCKKVSTVDSGALTLEPLFTAFTMPGAATNAQILALEELKINVEAHAIQAAGFETADEAWGKFSK